MLRVARYAPRERSSSDFRPEPLSHQIQVDSQFATSQIWYWLYHVNVVEVGHRQASHVDLQTHLLHNVGCCLSEYALHPLYDYRLVTLNSRKHVYINLYARKILYCDAIP